MEPDERFTAGAGAAGASLAETACTTGIGKQLGQVGCTAVGAQQCGCPAQPGTARGAGTAGAIRFDRHDASLNRRKTCRQESAATGAITAVAGGKAKRRIEPAIAADPGRPDYRIAELDLTGGHGAVSSADDHAALRGPADTVATAAAVK